MMKTLKTEYQLSDIPSKSNISSHFHHPLPLNIPMYTSASVKIKYKYFI